MLEGVNHEDAEYEVLFAQRTISWKLSIAP
jgi:hypothetical protein